MLTATCKCPGDIYKLPHQVPLRDQGSGSGAPATDHCCPLLRFQGALQLRLTSRCNLVWLESCAPILKLMLTTTIHIFNPPSSQAPFCLDLSAPSWARRRGESVREVRVGVGEGSYVRVWETRQYTQLSVMDGHSIFRLVDATPNNYH